MKKFKTKSVKSNKYELAIILVVLLVSFFINHYNKRISPKLLDIASTKIEEITNIYIKNNIVPKNVELDKLIVIDKNKNDEILYVDIDTNYANQIMIDVVKKIQNNIFDFEIDDSIIKKHNQNTYIELPLFISEDGALLSNLGPKIPIKLTFYEHAFGNIEVEVVDYGINNALIKVVLSISLEQKIYIPYKDKKENKTFSLIIGSKIINGTVPSIYGGAITKTSTNLNAP